MQILSVPSSLTGSEDRFVTVKVIGIFVPGHKSPSDLTGGSTRIPPFKAFPSLARPRRKDPRLKKRRQAKTESKPASRNKIASLDIVVLPRDKRLSEKPRQSAGTR
jgi:hypothetical protein